MDAVGRVLARYHPADPLHGAHVKLPVAQLWRLGDAGGGALSLHGHPVVRVEVVGTVVRRHVTDGRLVFVVDDTSGARSTCVSALCSHVVHRAGGGAGVGATLRT